MSELVPSHARQEISYLPLIYIVRVPWFILLVGGRHDRRESSESMYERQIMCVGPRSSERVSVHPFGGA